MKEEIEFFVNSLCHFIENEIKDNGDVEYSQRVIVISDARNYLYSVIDGSDLADKSDNIFLLSDLCMIDVDMETIPNRTKIEQIAKNYWDDCVYI